MRILINLFREVPKWDRPSQIALAIALILVIVDLIILSTQPTLQTPALIGAVGLLLAIQAIFMWGNRNLVTEITKAQRQMIAGQFDDAITTLTGYIEQTDQPQLDALVLIGNAYRNLGQLEASETWLQRALERRVDHHFALYGLGKTALAQGDYAFAIDHFKEALARGGQLTTHFDLAVAYFLQDDLRSTLSHLDKLPEIDAAYRVLFIEYMRFTIKSQPPSAWTTDGLPFWKAEVDRFRHTPYGRAMAIHVEKLAELL